MALTPVFDVDLAALQTAYHELRASTTALPRSRWWKALLVLGQRHEAGLLPVWTDVTLQPPRPLPFQSRTDGTAALDALFGQPAAAILRRDRPDGAWARLDRPEHVLVDPVSGQDPNAVMVAAKGEDGPWRRITVPLTDRCLAFNPPSALCDCHADAIREYNPISNEFGQQQGLLCCFPTDELAAMGAGPADAFLRAPRRECPYRQPTFICEVSGYPCASKGVDSKTGHHSEGTGGPKALLYKATPSADAGRFLAPGWVAMLADAATGGQPTLRPRLRDLGAVIGWGTAGPDAATAPTVRVRVRVERLHQLLGHQVAFAALRE